MDRRYVILEPLGSGGMGTVYRARCEGPGDHEEEVAMKLASSSFNDADALELLSNEARVLGVVHHRAVVRTRGLIRVSGRWALVTEYIEGARLDVLVQEGAVPIRAALAIVSEIAAALHMAQNSPTPRGGGRLGMTHRDLKPCNLMLTAEGGIKILDFGIAMSSVSVLHPTLMESTEGSQPYLSPERLQSIEGPEADIYALGVVLHDMLVPTAFGPATSLRDAHKTKLDRATTLILRLDAPQCVGLYDFILRMLAYDPAVRPTAGEVERHCEEWASQAPGIDIHSYASSQVPALQQRQRANLAELTDSFLLPGTILFEELAELSSQVLPSYTSSTPSSGGMGLNIAVDPEVSPLESVRALLAFAEPNTLKRIARTHTPDADPLDDRWLEDNGMMRHLAVFAAICLLVAFGLALFFAMKLAAVTP